MADNGKNYISYSALMPILVICMLLGIRFIPDNMIQAAGLKRADIIADLMPAKTVASESSVLVAENASPKITKIDTTVLDPVIIAELQPMSQYEPEAPIITDSATHIFIDSVKPAPKKKTRDSVTLPTPENIVEIEDFGSDIYELGKFFDAINSGSDIRIAVMGDSFIEGDIFTADIREQLQRSYGGRGVGYVPMASPVSGMRPTVKHLHSGWNTKTILSKSDKTTRFPIAGTYFTADEGATVSFEGTKYRRNLGWFSRFRFLYSGGGNTLLEVTVNKGTPEVYNTEAGETIHQLEIKSDSIYSVAVKAFSTEGFISYGAFLDIPTGISVDNLSLRGNSGTPMASVSKVLTSEIRQYVDYNLIILQYGLNVANANTTVYDSYKRSMVSVVNKIKEIYPNASIIIMGVGDRGTRLDGQFVTMPGIPGMIKAQRELAEECDVAFWNTFAAMGGENSMARFVEWNWAAKDYTHIGFRGGKHIADGMIKALVYAKTVYDGQTPQ